MEPEQWQRIKDTFARIVDEPTTKREALLEELCAGDAELRREVESLLQAHDETGAPLPTDGFRIRTRLKAEALDYAGRAFGSYRILRELGRGGMGAVFLAERADGEFTRQVAIKVVRRSIADPELERRFRRERQILATLNHPNIAHLLDGGVSADGEPFFVMEYVDGLRIDEYCAKTQPSTHERLGLFSSVCRAVAHAHDQSVIHRDLKPSNVLVTKEGVPKLLDFGIAKVLDAGGASDQTITEWRAFTPDYAAPEQVRGDQRLTASADVFSLGVMLAAIFGVSSKDPSRIASLDRNLQTIIMTARHPEAAQRYASARQLAQDVDRYAKGLPIAAQPPVVVHTVALSPQRSTTAIVAAMVFTLFVAGMVAMTFVTTRETPVRRTDRTTVSANPLASVKSIAVLPLRSIGASDRRDDRALRVGMADSIVTKLSQIRQLAVRPTSATVGYLDVSYDATAVGRELRVDTVLEGTLHRVGEELRTNLQLVDVASGTVVWADSLTSDLSNVLRGQESLANRVRQLLAFNVSSTAATEEAPASPNLEAQDAYLKGYLALATSMRQVSNVFAARDAFEHAIRLEPDFAPAHAGLANAYSEAGSLTLLAPQDSYPKAEKAARRALAIDPNLAGAYIALAEVEADYNWNWAAAEANHRRALELRPNSAQAHFSYGEFLARMGRFAESATHTDLGQQLDPTRVNYTAVRGLHLYLEHRFGDAIAQSHKAIQQDRTTYLAYLYLSVAHAARGTYDDGLKAARDAAALTGGVVSDWFVAALNYALMNDRANAEAMLQRMHAASRERYVDPFLFVAVYAYLGDKTRAFEYLERSYAERSYWMTTLRVHPVVDSLRGDPRFVEMVQRMRLE